MKSLNMSQLARAITTFLHRFHVTLFVVFVIGGLSLVTLFLNQAITKQADDISTSTQEPPFDQSTMDKISNLHTTSDRSELQFPSGRVDPFR